MSERDDSVQAVEAAKDVVQWEVIEVHVLLVICLVILHTLLEWFDHWWKWCVLTAFWFILFKHVAVLVFKMEKGLTLVTTYPLAALLIAWEVYSFVRKFFRR